MPRRFWMASSPSHLSNRRNPGLAAQSVLLCKLRLVFLRENYHPRCQRNHRGQFVTPRIRMQVKGDVHLWGLRRLRRCVLDTREPFCRTLAHPKNNGFLLRVCEALDYDGRSTTLPRATTETYTATRLPPVKNTNGENSRNNSRCEIREGIYGTNGHQ